MKTKIDGVEIIDRKIIRDTRGSVKHGLRADEKWYINSAWPAIGEIYFSEVQPNIIKGWHLHSKMTLRYICVRGRATVFLWDLRENSPTFEIPMMLELAANGPHYRLLVIPPNVWNAFRAKEGESHPAMICNMASIPHDPGEMKRAPISGIKYPLNIGNYDKDLSN